MQINPNRIKTVSQVRTSISAVLDDAKDGFTTHISRDDRIEAHIVPATALVHQGAELDIMMYATIEQWTRWLAAEARKSGFYQAGDPIGHVFAWLWRSAPKRTMKYLAAYSSSIEQVFAEQGWARPCFRVVLRALVVALGAGLTNDEIREFDAYAHEHLPDWPNPFTLDEFAGRERPRGDNDPWPDTTPSGKGWVKTRWRDVTAGAFVPNPEFSFELSTDYDHWCRVREIQGDTVTLEHHHDDSSSRERRRSIYTMADAGSHWVPVQDEPHRWSS